MPCAQEIADKVGMQKTDKDATQVYDKAYGAYQPHPHNYPASTPLPNEKQPFGNVTSEK